jgi:hypothetical protein
MTRRVKEKLNSGYQVAIDRICSIHRCHELFAPFGVDGFETLTATLYYPANPRRETYVCDKALAFTTLQASQTWLCRRFSRLSDEYAATILIHEALHHAGLGKHHPEMSSGDIDIKVKRACGF